MQTLINLDSSSGKNYYTNPSKNNLPANYPKFDTINTLPDNYPKIAIQNYWVDGHFTNYPSLWSVNEISKSTFDMTPALGPYVVRLGVNHQASGIGGYKIEVDDSNQSTIKTLYVSTDNFNTSNKYDITGLTPCTQYNIHIYSTDSNPSTTPHNQLNLSKPTNIPVMTLASQRIYLVKGVNNIKTKAATSAQPFNIAVRPNITKGAFATVRNLYYDVGDNKTYVVNDPITFSYSNFFVTNPGIISDSSNAGKYVKIPANSIFYNVDIIPTNSITVDSTYNVILPLSESIPNKITLIQTSPSTFNQTTKYKFRTSAIPINDSCIIPAPVPLPVPAPVPHPAPAPMPAVKVPPVPSNVVLELDGTNAPYNIVLKFPDPQQTTGIGGFRLTYGSYTDDIKISDLLSDGSGKYYTLKGTYPENSTVTVDIYSTTDTTIPYDTSPLSSKLTKTINVITIPVPSLAINSVGPRAMLLESTKANPPKLTGYKISGGSSNIYIQDSYIGNNGLILSNFTPKTQYTLQIYGTFDTTPDSNSRYGMPQMITQTTVQEHRIATISNVTATNNDNTFAYFYNKAPVTVPVYIDLNTIKNTFVYGNSMPLTPALAKQLFVINRNHNNIGTVWYNSNANSNISQIKVYYPNNKKIYPLSLGTSITTITINDSRPAIASILGNTLVPPSGTSGTPAYGGSCKVTTDKSKIKTLRKNR